MNQNAFSNIKVGATIISADSKTDTFELEQRSSITLTPDAANGKVTVAVSQGPGSGLNADKLVGYHASTGTTASTIPVRDANGKLPGSITGDAASVGGKVPGVANGLATLDASSLVAQDSAYSSGVSGFTPASVKAALDALAGVRTVEIGTNSNGTYIRGPLPRP